MNKEINRKRENDMEQKDLTRGPIFKTMCMFALPMILGNILQQCYNVVDTWVVGKFVGSDALAAVGSASAAPPSFPGRWWTPAPPAYPGAGAGPPTRWNF